MDQNEWENARVSMDFKLLAHHYMDLDHPKGGKRKIVNGQIFEKAANLGPYLSLCL